MPRSPRRADPEPLQTNDTLIVWIGIAAWAMALVVLTAFFRDDLRRHDSSWWVWSCVIGIGIGLYGLWFIRRRARD